MSQPRYQIFVSSTFRDLQEERQAVLNAILKLNQFPAGMEIFPAVNDTAWEHIEKVIKDSNYYVLIIGRKYGSIDSESGLSYTEKEYDFAVSQNIPVLAFTHSDEESIPIGKSEINSDVREKLQNFKQKVGNKLHWNYWKTLDELKANVIASLSMAFVMNPQNGWVKAGGIDNTKLLSILADLQQRYDKIVEENTKIKNSALFFDIENFLQVNDIVNIKFSFYDEDIKSIELSFDQILSSIGEILVIQCEIDEIRANLEEVIFNFYKESSEYIKFNQNESGKYKNYFSVSINSESLLMIEVQLQVLELINVSSIVKQYIGGTTIGLRNIKGQNQTYIEKTWQFTDKGRKFYLNQKALRQKYH